MTATETQILTMYEELGLEIEDILKQVSDLDGDSIKICLHKYSPKYRQLVKAKPQEFGFSDLARMKAREVIEDILTKKDDHLAFKAARYIRDDSEGRLDIYNESKKGGALGRITINQFNITLQKAKEALKRVTRANSKLEPDKDNNNTQQSQQQLIEV